MKISDLFSRIQKGAAATGAESGKSARLVKPVQPVGQAGRLQFVPGQLLQGQVVGEDSNGNTLLKLAGELISARTAAKLEMGQQFWFEVKEAGDMPLLALASRKGAVQELLRDIMATRSLLVKTAGQQGPAGGDSARPGSPSSAPSEQASPPPPSAGSVSPPSPSTLSSPTPAGQAAPVITGDGHLPPEAARLVKALALYVRQAQATMPAAAGSSERPSPALPLIKTMTAMIHQGHIPDNLQEMAIFKNVVRPTAAQGPATSETPDSASGSGQRSTGMATPPAGEQTGGMGAVQGRQIGGQGQVPLRPETIKVLNALVAIAGVKVSSAAEQGGMQPALQPDQNLAEIITRISVEGKVPVSLRTLTPIRLLMASGLEEQQGRTGQTQVAMAEGAPAQGGVASNMALPLQFAAAQQGSDPLPGQLRLLATLMGLGTPETASKESWQQLEDIFGQFRDSQAPTAARKLASFFEAHSRVNAEPAPQGNPHFYIIPSLFAGQAGWGEWLWSREPGNGAQGGETASQESLVFFLEMSNLGALTIQVILNDKKLRGKITMADREASALITALLPGLQARLEGFGYVVEDLACDCQPLNVMQELKERLQVQAGAGPVSLLDVQA